MRLLVFVFVAPLYFACAPPCAQSKAAPHQASELTSIATKRVVFLGDSITWHNNYVAYIELQLMTQSQSPAPVVFNRGKRGDTATKALSRLSTDVFDLKPDLVFVMLGMNDGGYQQRHRGLLKTYLSHMRSLVRSLQAQGTPQVILLSPTCVSFERQALRDYNLVLDEMSAQLGELATELNVVFIDVHTPFCRALSHAHKLGASSAMMLDEIHPNQLGHKLIAHVILSRLDIDFGVQPHTFELRQGVEASDYQVSVDHTAIPIFGNLDVLATELVSYAGNNLGPKLQIPHARFSYQLSVDGQQLTVLSAQQLRVGVSLSTLPLAPWNTVNERLAAQLMQCWALMKPLDETEKKDISTAHSRQASLQQHHQQRRARAQASLQECERKILSLRKSLEAKYRLILSPDGMSDNPANGTVTTQAESMSDR